MFGVVSHVNSGMSSPAGTFILENFPLKQSSELMMWDAKPNSHRSPEHENGVVKNAKVHHPAPRFQLKGFQKIHKVRSEAYLTSTEEPSSILTLKQNLIPLNVSSFLTQTPRQRILAKIKPNPPGQFIILAFQKKQDKIKRERTYASNSGVKYLNFDNNRYVVHDNGHIKHRASLE